MSSEPIFRADGFTLSSKDDDRSVSSSSEHLGTSTGDESNNDQASPTAGAVDVLAAGEAMARRRSKVFVVAALALAAGIGTLIFFLMSNDEWTVCEQNVSTIG
jgi:hypothetical protein